jgi:hypothetical protein
VRELILVVEEYASIDARRALMGVNGNILSVLNIIKFLILVIIFVLLYHSKIFLIIINYY